MNMRSPKAGLTAACILVMLFGMPRPGGGGPPSGPTTVKIVAREFVYEPKGVTAPVGVVTLTMENRGAVEHDLVVEGARRRKLAEIPPIQPGKTEDVTVILTPGAYTLVCTVPGHREAGMVGVLRIEHR
jgi:plastocyanin